MNDQNQALKFLSFLATFLESFEALDVEEGEDFLFVTTSHNLKDKRQYLLNYHGVTHQLWLSSSVSGAHHFQRQGPDWICTRTCQPILSILENELKDFGVTFQKE